MEKEALGKKIREVREKKGYSRQALAEMATTGAVYLGEIERGLKMPSLNSFIRIIEALEVSADYILRGEISAGKHVVYDNLTDKLEPLTPKQRECVAEMIDTYVKYL